MKKLYQLREWLTLDEAAAHLSRTLTDAVTVADLLHLGLDGHLKLSAHFVNHAPAKLGRAVPIADADLWILPKLLGDFNKNKTESAYAKARKDFPVRGRAAQNAWLAEHDDVTDEVIVTFEGDVMPGDESVLQFADEVESISGVWDLVMFGGERLDVEHRLQQELGGPEVTLMNIAGAFVVSADGTTFAKILEHHSENPYYDQSKKYPYKDPASYDPAGGLPSDAPIVIRTKELDRCLTALINESDDRPLDSRERTTLLCIIGALAQAAGLDVSQPMKSGNAIAAMMPGVQVTARTIGEHLKAVREAVDSRKG